MSEISSLNLYEVDNKSKHYGKNNCLVTTPERYSIRIESANRLNKSDKNLLNTETIVNDNRKSSNTISSENSSLNYRNSDVNASPYAKANIKTSSNQSYNYDNTSSSSCKDDFDERCHNHEELNLNWSKTPSGSVSTRTHTISPHENYSSERTQDDEMKKGGETNTDSVESKPETISPTTISEVFVSQFSGNTELNYLGSGAVEIAPEIFVQSDYYLMIYIPTLDTKLPRMYTKYEDDKDNILKKAVCRIQEISARSNHSLNETYRSDKPTTNVKSTSTDNEIESNFFNENQQTQNSNSGFVQQMDIFPIPEISEKSENSTTSKSDRNKVECEIITNDITEETTCKSPSPKSPKRCWFHNKKMDIEEFVTTTVLEDYVKWKNSVSDCPDCKAVIETGDTKYNLATDTFSKQPNIKSNLLSIQSQKQNLIATDNYLPNEVINSNEDEAKNVVLGEINRLKHKQILDSFEKNPECKLAPNETLLKCALNKQGIKSYENKICNIKQEEMNLIKDKTLKLNKDKKSEFSEASEMNYNGNNKLDPNDNFESGENCKQSNVMLPTLFNRQNMKSTKISNFQPSSMFRVQHNIEPTNSRSISSANSSTSSSDSSKYSCLPFFHWFEKLFCKRRNVIKKKSFVGSRNSFYFSAPSRRPTYDSTNYKNRYPLFKCNSNIT